MSGVEDDSFKKHTLLQGEIHTGTGLILEKDAMVNGEVWGDKHDKQDKFNEQVKYSNVSKILFSKCFKKYKPLFYIGITILLTSVCIGTQ